MFLSLNLKWNKLFVRYVNERIKLLNGYIGKNIIVINSDLIVPFNTQYLNSRLTRVEKDGQTGFYYLRESLTTSNKFNIEFLRSLMVENDGFNREWNEVRKKAKRSLKELAIAW